MSKDLLNRGIQTPIYHALNRNEGRALSQENLHLLGGDVVTIDHPDKDSRQRSYK